MNKRGQFFLVAAVIIVGIIIGFSATVNSANVNEENTYVYNLGNEIEFETKEVLNYGVFNKRESLIDDTKNFLIEYDDYVAQGSDEILFIYGDKQNIQGIYFSDMGQGRVGLNTGSIPNTFNISVRGNSLADVSKTDFEGDGEYDRVDVIIKDIRYTFNLNQDQNLFLILGKTQNGDRTVVVR